MARTVLSLVEIPADQPATVRRILFDGVREWCGELGIHEGDRLVSDGTVGASVVLRTGAGGSLRCPAELARFIEVERVPGGIHSAPLSA